MKRLILVMATLVISMEADAQFKYFTTENGLQSNTVKSLYQSSDGQIWAGTSKGLCRHDGIRFSDYGISDVQSFRTEVFSICESKDQSSLWVGCTDGLYSLDKKSLKISKIDAINGLSDELESGIHCLCMDSNGNLWIGSNGKGLFRYDVQSQTCFPYPECSKDQIISRILMTNDNVVWFCALYDDCIYRYTPGRDEFVRIPIIDKFSKEKAHRIVDFCQDSYGDIWICDSNCTLFRLHPYDMQFVSYKSSLSKINDVRVMIENKPEELIIGTNVGLVSFDCNTMSFSWLDQGNVRNDGKLNDRFIYSLLKDKDSGLWVGTYFGGVNYKSPTSDIIKSVLIPDNCGKIISVMYETDKSSVLIGSDDGGLSQYDFNSRTYKKINFDYDNPNLNIHCIYPDGEKIWVGTYGNGLYRLDKRLSEEKHYDTSEGNRTDLHVYSALRDQYDDLWIGTPQGICKYDSEKDCFATALFFDKGNDVTDIIEWDSQIYFASQGKGLIRYNREKNEFEYLSEGVDLPNRISTLEMFNSTLYIGSFEGLYTYDGQNFRKCDNSMLTENNISSITADNNSLWITTTDGLFCYWNDDKIERYGRESGLSSESFNTNSSIKLSNGELLVGTERGLCSFKSAELSQDKETRQVGTVITEFNLLTSDGGAGERISCLNQIRIKKRNASFSISFSSLNYQAPQNSSYRYMLDGYDKDYKYLPSGEYLRNVIYTSVGPGSYLFKVSAKATDTGQYGEEQSIDIQVRRPFSSWIRIFLILILIAIVMVTITKVILNNNKVRKYLKSIRNAQIEKSIYETMLKNMMEETRNTLGRLKMSLETNYSGGGDNKEPNNRLIRNNLDNLFSLIEKDSQKLRALGAETSSELNIIEPVSDASRIIESMLMTYQDLSENAFNIKFNYTVTNNARNFPARLDLNGVLKDIRNLLDQSLEKSFSRIDATLDTADTNLILYIKSDGKDYHSYLIQSQYPTNELKEIPVHHKKFNKDTFNIIILGTDGGYFSGHIKVTDTVFNVVVCENRKEAEIGLSSFPITAIVCQNSNNGLYDIQYLIDLKKQYPQTLFIALSSSLDDSEKIMNLGQFADISMSRPASITLIASQILKLMGLKNTRKNVTKDSSILKKIEQSDNFTKSVCEIIKEKITKTDLSVNDLSEAMNVSRATLFNRLKASLDITPNNLIRDIRLEMAAEMLTQGNVRVSDVYYKLGFTSGSYFSKLFHERYGLTPKDYSR